MSVAVGRNKLNDANRTLKQRWQVTRASWQDAMADRFSREHLHPLQSRVREALSAMEHMDELINRARRECQ